MNASDMKGGTMHTDVNVSASKLRSMRLDDCSSRGGCHGLRKRVRNAQPRGSVAGGQNPASQRPLSGVFVFHTFRSPRLVRAMSAAGEKSQKFRKVCFLCKMEF